ncbi:30S ribosomal protein S5 [Candidatus Woesearchaeota archaeon]|nr:30S ribosomal protein S5 [Candidatus Woesearchaeota archaeon]MCF7901357.1 30S ribosomal protein S5 [Candidatus Woesearchaeota archaeon]MCF8013357.1 30S ribosomal protein S5 [Candidatus Woesearchaeota archaeon]
MPKKKITKKEEPEELVVLEPTDEESTKPIPEETSIPENWQPKTELGKKVKSGEITNMDQILDNGMTILEPEIVDSLLAELDSELLLIGQAKGKFGGGQRRIFRQTQKKTREGNKPKFTTLAVVGNKNGYIGIGIGKSKETVPAREKAIKNAKLNIFKITRGAGSWASNSKEPTSIPYAVEGKVGSVKIKLMPAPKGKGLCVEKECGKILALAGIKDVWAKTEGQTKNKINLITACEKALRNLISTKTRPQDIETLSIQEGRLRLPENE